MSAQADRTSTSSSGSVDSLAPVPRPGDFTRPRSTAQTPHARPLKATTAATTLPPVDRPKGFFRLFASARSSSSSGKGLAPPSLALSPSTSTETPSLSRSHPSQSSAEGTIRSIESVLTIAVLEPVPTRTSLDAQSTGNRSSSQSLREKKSDWALYMAAITEAESRKRLPAFPSMGVRDPAPRMGPVPLSVLTGDVDPPTVRQSTRPAKPRGPAPHPNHRPYAEPAGLTRPRDVVNAPPPRRSDSPTSRTRSAPRERHSFDDLRRDVSPKRSLDDARAVRDEQRTSRELRQRVSAADIRRRMESESPRRTEERALISGQLPAEEMAASRSLPRDVLMSSIVGMPPPPGVIAHARREEDPRRSGPPRMPLPEAPRSAPPRSHPLAEAQAQSRSRPSPSRPLKSAPQAIASDSRPASAGPSASTSRTAGPPEPHPLAKRGPAHASTSVLETSHHSSGFAALSSYQPPPPSALDGVKLADILGPNAPAYNKSGTSLQAQRIEEMKQLNKLNTSGPRVAPPSRRSPLSMAPVSGAGARSAVSSYGAQIKTNKADGGRKLHKSVRAPMEREPRQPLSDSARYVAAGEDQGL